MEIVKVIRSEKTKPRLTRVYINPVGETLFENYTSGRFTRPRDEFKSSGWLEKVLVEEMGYERGSLPNTRWSSVGGCSCKCSPAFIVYGEQSKKYGYDLFCEYDPKTLQGKAKQLEPGFVKSRAKALYDVLGLPIDLKR